MSVCACAHTRACVIRLFEAQNISKPPGGIKPLPYQQVERGRIIEENREDRKCTCTPTRKHARTHTAAEKITGGVYPPLSLRIKKENNRL